MDWKIQLSSFFIYIVKATLRKNPNIIYMSYFLLSDEAATIIREQEHEKLHLAKNIETERFKRSFLNRCLFDYFN
jgi:hypothetical protein